MSIRGGCYESVSDLSVQFNYTTDNPLEHFLTHALVIGKLQRWYKLTELSLAYISKTKREYLSNNVHARCALDTDTHNLLFFVTIYYRIVSFYGKILPVSLMPRRAYKFSNTRKTLARRVFPAHPFKKLLRDCQVCSLKFTMNSTPMSRVVLSIGATFGMLKGARGSTPVIFLYP